MKKQIINLGVSILFCVGVSTILCGAGASDTGESLEKVITLIMTGAVLVSVAATINYIIKARSAATESGSNKNNQLNYNTKKRRDAR